MSAGDLSNEEKPFSNQPSLLSSQGSSGKIQKAVSSQQILKKIKHSCRTCNRDIIDECYIQCTRCKGFIQCLECFSIGAESICHLRSHPIILMDPTTSPFFTTDWSSEEELLLLQAISLCGIGNWIDISNQIKTKSPIECEIHYFETYFSPKTAPYPEFKVKDPYVLPPPVPFNTKPQESCPSCGHEKILALNGKKEKATPAEFCGYMPMRHEFEEEYKDEAEHIVDNIIFDENDTYQTLEQKLKSLEIYNSALQARRRRTKIVEDWGDNDLKFKSLGGQTAREKDTNQKILTLAPFLGKEKTVELSNLLHQIISDTETIENKQIWQKNGITSEKEGMLFTKLQSMIKDGRVPESEVGKWNKAITDYNNEHDSQNLEDSKLLSQREIDLCMKYDIAPAMFVAVKDLIIREHALRDGLTKEEAVNLLPDSATKIEAIYDLFVSMGWIY